MSPKRLFTGISLWSADRPLFALMIVALITVMLSAGISRLEMNVSNEAMFSEDDPALRAYRDFQHQFGRDDIAVAAISSEHIFTGEFMQKLTAFHDELEQTVPWLEDVTSLSNVDYITADGGGLNVAELGDMWPNQGRVDKTLQDDVLSSPLYKNTLISADGKMTLVVLRSVAFSSPELKQDAKDKRLSASNHVTDYENETFGDKVIRWHDQFKAHLAGEEYQPKIQKSTDTGSPQAASKITSGQFAESDSFFDDELIFDDVASEHSVTSHALPKASGQDNTFEGLNTIQLDQFLSSIKDNVEKYNNADFDIALMGGPVIDKAHQDAIHSDVILLIALALLIIVTALALLLRTWLAVVVPLCVILCSLLSTIGLMGWLGIPVSVISQALPPLLLTAGVLDSVHLLGIYYRKKDEYTSVKSALAYTFEHAGMAVFYTSITTAAGFISFTVARLQPIADFGWMSAFGVMLAMLFSFILVPALAALYANKTRPKKHVQRWDRLANILLPIANFSVKHKGDVVIGIVFVIALGLPGIFNLTYSHNVLMWFDEDVAVRQDTVKVDDKMDGTVPLEVVIDSGVKNGILTPEFMAGLRAFQDRVQALEVPNVHVGRATSIVDSLQRIHGQIAPEMNELLPQTERLIHQEIILYEGGGAKEIVRLTNREYSLARVTIRLDWTDAKNYVEIRQVIAEEAQQIFANIGTVKLSGTVDILSVGVVDVIKSMVSSYLLAILLVGIMLILLLKRVGFGLICLIPNFLPIYIGLAGMGYLGIPIDMFTVLLGGIALGLVVDDTVHLTNNIFFELTQQNNHDEANIQYAVNKAIRKIGPALIVTTGVMALGFSAFTLSSIAPLSMLGLLLCIVMVLALIGDVLIIPALVAMFEINCTIATQDVKQKINQQGSL